MINKICFIAINFNNAQLTLNFVKNLNGLTKSNPQEILDIIIIDNGSNQEDICILDKETQSISNVTLIKSSINHGYFGGLNLGLKYIKNSSYKYVIICNNDLEFDSDFLLKLDTVKFGKSVLALAPDVETVMGVHQNPLRKTRISKIEKVKNDIYWSNYYIMIILKTVYNILKTNKTIKNTKINKSMYIEAGIGACYVLTSHFFKYYSLLDAKVFLWGEEAIFSEQVRRVSGKILYVPDLHVLHKESQSVKKIPSRKKYEMVRKSYNIYKKYL